MNSKSNVIEFKSAVKSNKNAKANNENLDNIDNKNANESYVSYPTEVEIRVMKAMIEQYTEEDPDIMVPINMWDGDCFHTIFDEMSEYAKEIDADPWDTFALFIQKLMNGWRMEETEDGGVKVIYGNKE